MTPQPRTLKEQTHIEIGQKHVLLFKREPGSVLPIYARSVNFQELLPGETGSDISHPQKEVIKGQQYALLFRRTLGEKFLTYMGSIDMMKVETENKLVTESNYIQ